MSVCVLYKTGTSPERWRRTSEQEKKNQKAAIFILTAVPQSLFMIMLLRIAQKLSEYAKWKEKKNEHLHKLSIVCLEMAQKRPTNNESKKAVYTLVREIIAKKYDRRAKVLLLITHKPPVRLVQCCAQGREWASRFQFWNVLKHSNGCSNDLKIERERSINLYLLWMKYQINRNRFCVLATGCRRAISHSSKIWFRSLQQLLIIQ